MHARRRGTQITSWTLPRVPTQRPPTMRRPSWASIRTGKPTHHSRAPPPQDPLHLDCRSAGPQLPSNSRFTPLPSPNTFHQREESPGSPMYTLSTVNRGGDRASSFKTGTQEVSAALLATINENDFIMSGCTGPDRNKFSHGRRSSPFLCSLGHFTTGGRTKLPGWPNQTSYHESVNCAAQRVLWQPPLQASN